MNMSEESFNTGQKGFTERFDEYENDINENANGLQSHHISVVTNDDVELCAVLML